MPGERGRPRKYNSPEAFDEAVQDYLDKCAADSLPLTWTGLALHLGFSSRQSIDEYLNYDGFSDSVKKAKLAVECSYEMRLQGSSQPTGAIFALKNYGWTDKQGLEHSGPDGGPMKTELSGDALARRVAFALESASRSGVEAGAVASGDDE